MRRICFALGLAVFIAGCQTTSATVGSGAITIAPQVDRYFRTVYLTNESPGFFILSSDGAWFDRTFCSLGPGACEVDDVVLDAVRSCERRARRQCHIYAKGRDVVWEGSVIPGGTYAASWKNHSVLGEENVSDETVCKFAIGSDGKSWSTEPAYRSFVMEAKARGLDPEMCK